MGVALGVAVSGCVPQDDVSWGVLHGGLTVDDDGSARGVLVWEFFSDDWSRARSSAAHQCARLLSVEGEPNEGCADCALDVGLQVVDDVSDCGGTEATESTFAELSALQLAPNTTSSPHTPGDRWEWRVGWSTGAALREGVAWDEGVEWGEPPDDLNQVRGRRIVLGPDTARRLAGGDGGR